MRVVLADDSLLLREGLAHLLDEAGFEVVGQAATGDELLGQVDVTHPDVAIVDIRMPPTHPDEGVRAAHGSAPATRTSPCSSSPSSSAPATRSSSSPKAPNGSATCSRTASQTSSVRRVADGESVLDPLVVEQLVSRPRSGPDPLDDLTEREREVLELMAQGRSNQAIGPQLYITEHTVEKHVKNILGKLRIPTSADDHRRVLAVLTYLDST